MNLHACCLISKERVVRNKILEESAIKGGDRLFIRKRFVSQIAKDFNFLMDNKKEYMEVETTKLRSRKQA